MLEQLVSAKEPEDADVIVYDGFFILYFNKDISSSFGNILTNFKEALVADFIKHWTNDYMAPYIGRKIVNVNCQNTYRFSVNDAKVTRTIENT